ncbi:MAG: sigma 54-interacting transcriptional regulator [Candidatus Hydrogenedentes bacterium]|nr:sigma 54-interacting transcriptional regulator [Candidatus Hydrogenedentota bacterium]
MTWPIGPDRLVLGRAPNCDVFVPDSLASRHHCEIVTTGDDVFLTDLGSSNATLVNGRPAKQCALRPGDEIAIGRSLFLVTTSDVPSVQGADDFGGATTVNLGEDQSQALGDVTAELVAKAYPNSVTELAVLFDVSRRCSRSASITDLISVIFDAIEAYFHPTTAWVGLHQSLSGELVFYSPQSIQSGDSTTAPNEVQRKAKKALARREGLNIPVISREGEAQRLATLLAAPIDLAGQQIGCAMLRLEAENRLPSDNDLRFLVALAQTSAPYFQSMRQMDRLRRDNQSLRAVARVSTGLIGESAAMNHLRALVEKAAMSELNALVTGETGTGKELVAHLLHEQSARSGGPLIVVNCAAIPPHLFESEFFGYEKGAFTGAAQRRIGLIEQANEGTLFLDEVGDLSMDNQAKLLRVLDSGRFFRVGGNRETRVDIRVIAATNKDVPMQVKRGEFREDLYHRLNGIAIPVPPLRERPADIAALAEHFFTMSLGRAKRPVTGISGTAMEYLLSHSWPGNVRQLRNTIERAIALTRSDLIQIHDVQSPAESSTEPDTDKTPLSLAEVEKRHIEKALKFCNNRVNDAARLLGIGRSTLYAKIAEYGLSAE